jgi:hypothetical protein
MNIRKVEASICLNDQVVQGQLTVGSGIWRFYAEDPYFTALFPSKSVCSFSTEQELAHPERAGIFHAVATQVAQLMLA